MADPKSETVVLEFFDETTGEDKFTMELSQEDFDSYSAMAESIGVPIEDFMVGIAEREIQERNTQWVIPEVDSFGRLILENSTPVDLSNVADRSK